MFIHFPEHFQFRFHLFPLRNIIHDGEVLVRFSSLVQEGHNGTIHPILVTILCFAAEVALPYFTLTKTVPHLSGEGSLIMIRIHHPEILANELFAIVSGYPAEIIVHPLYHTRPVCDHDHGKPVDGKFVLCNFLLYIFPFAFTLHILQCKRQISY